MSRMPQHRYQAQRHWYQTIESELQQLFPKASVARFDGDAAADATVEKRYQELYDGTIDIIIGTQVIAKGLDLPHLKLVGVVQADAGLALPDYAASERTFQLLAQVVGRVGRSSHQTTVVVQSYQPHAPAVARGLNQDYENFYQETIHERQRALFPPFRYLLKLTCVYKTEAAAIRNAQHLAGIPPARQMHRVARSGGDDHPAIHHTVGIAREKPLPRRNYGSIVT